MLESSIIPVLKLDSMTDSTMRQSSRRSKFGGEGGEVTSKICKETIHDVRNRAYRETNQEGSRKLLL